MTCYTCDFVVDDPKNPGHLYCFRLPPTYVSSKLYGQFPRVLKGSWCGEYKRREGLPEDESSINDLTGLTLDTECPI